MASPRSAPRAPFGATLTFIVVFAVAAFAVVMPLTMEAIRPVELGAPFPPQNQRAETLVYALAFLVLLPLAIVAGRRLADAVSRHAGVSEATALSGLLALGLEGAVLAVKAAERFLDADGVGVVLAAAIAWWLLAAVPLFRATRSEPWPALRSLARFIGPIWGLVAAGGFVVLLCFAQLSSISPAGLTLGLATAACATAAYARVRPRPLPRRWGLAVDLVAVAALLAVVPDLVIFRPEAAAGDLAVAFETRIVQFHHNFLLGPANEVLGGRPMLAGTGSQYGVGSIDFLAAWFKLAPIGYGTLGFLTGILTALWFAAGYAVLRLAGTSRLLAAPTLGVAVVALAYNLTYPVGALPQSGPLRFGMPMLVIVAAVAAARFPAHARAARVAGVAVVGLSSIWSLEAFAYTAAVYAALAGAQALAAAPRTRLRRMRDDMLAAALACVAAHALFAGATLAAAGELPDWGEYLAYLEVFLAGNVGDLTFDVARWTPALAVGAAYLASVAALAEVARRPGPLVERERTALLAITGMTTYGIALLSYYVDRSQDHILIHVALPALLTGALWLSVLLRQGPAVSRVVRTGSLAMALVIAALVVAVSWSSAGERFPRTAFAHAAPGGRSLGAALDRLWHPPPLHPEAPAGERALARQMPGEAHSLVMASPDLATEILLRSGRADALQLGYPLESSFVGADELPGLRAAVDGLRPGDRMLMDQAAREALATLRAQPSVEPTTIPIRTLAPLQLWALHRIAASFRLRPVAPAEAGFTVVELVPRR